MERIHKIMTHPLYVSCREKIDRLEKNRIFCRHGLSHSLDVARILYIKTLENNIPIKKDVIYAVALLHDIGRALEYEQGVSHHEAGVEISERILRECDYTKEECNRMLCAIGAHKEKTELGSILCQLLYEADKESRPCFECEASAQCYWSEERKNKTIIY